METAEISRDVEVSDDERVARREQLETLIALMAQSVALDGGELVLVAADVTSGDVTVELRGACSSCAISDDTLRHGVERILKQRLSWVKNVHGTAAEEDEENPVFGTGFYVPKHPM